MNILSNGACTVKKYPCGEFSAGRFLLVCDVNINDFLGKPTGAGTAGFVNVLRHTATAGIALSQAAQDLGGASVIMGGEEVLQFFCPALRFFTAWIAGAHLAQPNEKRHHLIAQILFLGLAAALGLLLILLISIGLAVQRLGLLAVFVHFLGVKSFEIHIVHSYC